MEVSFQRLLPSLSTVCRHTDVVHIRREGTATQGCRYVWVHRKIRPWGYDLPVQCQQCGYIRSWIWGEGQKGACLFACKTQGCSNKLAFNRDDRNWFGGEVNGGRWLKVDYNV